MDSSSQLMYNSQSSQSQATGSIDLFSDPPHISQTSQSQLSTYSEYPNPPSKNTKTRKNEKYYMRYLSAPTVSSTLCSQGTSQCRLDRDSTEEVGDFGSWKAKSESTGRRALLLDIIDTTRECKKEIEESTNSIKKLLENATSTQSNVASSMENKVVHGFDGQASMLRSILDAQEKMMEILLSLKRDTEMNSTKLNDIETSIASLTKHAMNQEEVLGAFQEKFDDLLSRKMLPMVKNSHSEVTVGNSQKNLSPEQSLTPGGFLERGADVLSSPLECPTLASTADSTTHLPFDSSCTTITNSTNSFTDSGLHEQEHPISNPMKRSPVPGGDPYTFPGSPLTVSSNRHKDTAAKLSPAIKVTSIRRKKRCPPQEMHPKKKKPKGKACGNQTRYSPLIALTGDKQPMSPCTITTHLRTIRTRSTVSKPSPINALDDSFYSAVCYSSPYHLQGEKNCSNLINWKGRRQEQSKRHSQVLKQPSGSESVLQEITAKIMRHCNVGKSQNARSKQH